VRKLEEVIREIGLMEVPVAIIQQDSDGFAVECLEHKIAVGVAIQVARDEVCTGQPGSNGYHVAIEGTEAEPDLLDVIAALAPAGSRSGKISGAIAVQINNYPSRGTSGLSPQEHVRIRRLHP
jgi:hypothetical protein